MLLQFCGQGVWPAYGGTSRHVAYKPRVHNLYHNLNFTSSICIRPLLPTFTRGVAGEVCPLKEPIPSETLQEQ
ncbi:hypothetical protein AMECASPLE_026041 [Ameca splendens]|uniref:Uncharacterized protein n=1 Tax=Ameca splendens TaxID=208324 RepID=A0ABV0XTU5_9TELE